MNISIVITVFNETPKHLVQCLNSVLAQSLRPDDYEIILVDDCSTDAGTAAAIEEFDQVGSRIRVIRQRKNLGLNEARRTGAKAAVGDYIVYIDGDDVLTSDAVESLRMQVLRTNADIVTSHFFRLNDANCTYGKLVNHGKPFPSDYRERLQTLLSLKSSFTMCGRLIRRSLLKDDVFEMPSRLLHEDLITFSRIIFEAHSVSSIDRHIYYYRWNPQSITSRVTDRHIEGVCLAFADWVKQAQRRGLLDDLAPAISEGMARFLNTIVARAAYGAASQSNEVAAVLEKLWRKLQELELPVRPNLKLELAGVKVFHEVTKKRGSIPENLISRLCKKYRLFDRPAYYDSNAVLPEGLLPSEMACRLKDKIVIICQVDYHFRNASTFAKQLSLRGYPCVVIDNSAFAAGGKRPVSAGDRGLLWRTEYLKIEKPPYGSDWLSTARLVVTFNDFNDDFREALEYRTLLGQRSVSMVEGINDFLRLDFDEPHYLPYRRCDTVYLAGQDDVQYFQDRSTYVIGLPVIEELARKQPKFPSRRLAILNVNFTYGVLEDRRDGYVAAAKKAFGQAGWDWVITQHPMDNGKLTGLPVSKQTQYELIDQGTVFVSRFATGILEALASGKPAIYFNPHGELVAKFKAPMGAFDIATTEDELVRALRRLESELAAGVDFRARALPFLAHNTGFLQGGATAAERFADAVADIVESDQEPSRRVAQLFFERLEARDRFQCDAPGLVFGELDRRHNAQLDETELVARYFGDRGQVMIDVGANIGQSADSFLGNGWTVYAFEPDPTNHRRLAELKRNHRRLYINTQAVSNQDGQKVTFYASDESTGISSLTAFTTGHKPVCEVETVTLRNYCQRERIVHVDFLKVDVEGHDKFVLDGFDWAADQPEVVLAEFEDAKTLQNGYSAHDLAGSLIARGYSIYVSEWLPIERYGLAHDWRRLVRYSPMLEISESWGNLIAFRDDPGRDVLRPLVQDTIKFAAKPRYKLKLQNEKQQPDVRRHDNQFSTANKLLRSGSYSAALQAYLNLYKNRPLGIYESNALWAARKLGYTEVKAAADFHLDNDGSWVPEKVRS